VEQINICLGSGDYSRALESLRGTAAEFPKDAELSELKKLAQDGIKRNTEANRLITESQELFAQQKSTEAIQLLRAAYELDKNNSRARVILANALVEHAISIVETDWWEAGLLAKQALGLNPAHPTAKTIRSLIADLKQASAVEEWVSQVSKVQTSGDLFAALSLTLEGLDVHPHDSRLLLLQNAIQRDQEARRRHARRGDLEDLRRMESEVDRATELASKRELTERIQAVAAKYWTDGQVLSVANSLLHRLGLVPQESSSAAPHSQNAPVIFHVPLPSAPEASHAANPQVAPRPVLAAQILPSEVLPRKVPPSEVSAGPIPTGYVATATVMTGDVPVSAPPQGDIPVAPPELQTSAQRAATVLADSSTPAAKVSSLALEIRELARSNSATPILISAAAVVLFAAIFFLARKHQAPPIAQSPAAAPTIKVPSISATTTSAPAVSAPSVSAPALTTPEPSQPSSRASSDSVARKIKPDDQPPAQSVHNLGALLVVAGQDDASVSLNGKPQEQLTHAGQLRVPNLELGDYVVQVSKSGFLDPAQQKIHIRKGEDAKLIFDLQPEPRLASLTIQGGAPGTTVLVDQALAGTIQPDGTLSVSTVNPGDHTVELRKDRFKSRQFKKHFVAGGTISFTAADATLEAAPGELKINFSPADATVAIVKGDLLKMVSSGVPLNVPPGSYTLTARTADSFTRSSTFEVIAGQSKTLDLSLAPNGLSKWEDPGAWKREGDSFMHKGGDFVLFGFTPTSGTFAFSAMLTKGHLLQWVLNYTDSKNYVLFQMDENNFYRTVIRNGEKRDQIIVPDKGDRKSFRKLHIRVTPTEVVHQVKHGNSWTVLDRWTQPGTDVSLGKFGFYLPGNDEVALSGFAHYVDLNIR
jgi:tetratricopeptide (TPR) repeat protein